MGLAEDAWLWFWKTAWLIPIGAYAYYLSWEKHVLQLSVTVSRTATDEPQTDVKVSLRHEQWLSGTPHANLPVNIFLNGTLLTTLTTDSRGEAGFRNVGSNPSGTWLAIAPAQPSLKLPEAKSNEVRI